MGLKRYKIRDKTPPRTEAARQAARHRQMIDLADKRFMTHDRLLIPAAVLTAAPGVLGRLIVRLIAALRAGGGGQADVWRLFVPPADYGSPMWWLFRLLPAALTLLAAPVLWLGFCQVCLKVWRGRAVGRADLTAFCRNGRFWPGLGFCARMSAATLLPAWLAGLLPAPGGRPELAVLLRLIAWLAGLIAGLRLAPAPLLWMLEAPSGRPKRVLGRAAALTRGRATGLLRYALGLFVRCLPLFVLYAALSAALAFLGAPSAAKWAAGGLLALSAPALPLPYMTLSLIAYLDGWLPTDSQARRKTTRPPSVDR